MSNWVGLRENRSAESLLLDVGFLLSDENVLELIVAIKKKTELFKTCICTYIHIYVCMLI